MSPIRFRPLIITATMVIACQGISFCLTSASVAKQETVENTQNCKNENCKNCKDGSCQTCQDKCKEGQCDDAVSAVAVAKPDTKVNKTTTLANTHIQTSTFTPKLNGRSAILSTFRVRSDGHIVACVSPSTRTPKSKGNQSVADQDATEPVGFIQVYSPDFELVQQYGLPFKPTALDIDKSGNMFAAGKGILSRLTPDGEITLSCDSPNLQGVDMEQLKEEIKEEIKKQQQQTQKMFAEQIERLGDRIQSIEEVDEDQRSKSDQAELQMAKSQLEMYENMLERQSNAEANQQMIEHRIKSKSRITAVTVTDEDVFVATSARTGSGYEVYRMTRDFTEPECVLKRLRGCCGQMDIHAVGDKIYVAENTKFNIGIYDREGEKVSSFGERLSKDNQGFGGCCNPMNVLCCPNGDILTAESSIGKIKRFDADGNKLEYVGRARIGGGCKHVAFGFDQNLDRYYVQYEDKNQICVLEADTDSERVLDPQVSKFAKRLTEGKWQLSSTIGDKSGQQAVGCIGVQLQTNDNGDTVVQDLIQGSPVRRRGRLSKGDVILAVGEFGSEMVDTSDMETGDVAEMIRGEEGTAIRIKFRSVDTGKTHRSSFRRVGMEMVDGQWVVQDDFADDAMSGGMGFLTDVKSFEFSDDGSVALELKKSSIYTSPGSQEGMTWLASRARDDTLLLDIESDQDIITYRVKVRFTEDNQAQIAVTYDGIGEAGKFRAYRLIPDDKISSDSSSVTASAIPAADSIKK